VRKSKPNYKEDTSSEDESEGEQEDVSSDESECSAAPVRRYSRSDMGERNGPFTKADMYFIAKYIASTPDWDILTGKDRWEPMHAKVVPMSANLN
jgi:hypothetical protein